MAEHRRQRQQSEPIGYADAIDRAGAAGWAFDPGHPDRRVELEILDNDAVVARIIADRFRDGLSDAGIGDGRHSFAVRFDPPLSTDFQHVVRIRIAATGRELEKSGVLLEPEPTRTSAEISFHIDHPAPAGGCAELTGHGNLFVEGWAIADQGVARIQVLLDGMPLGNAAHGLPRKGVQDAFPDRPNALLSGFAFSAPQPPEEGRHCVSVVIEDRTGFSRSGEFTLDVLPRSWAPAAWLPRRNLAQTELSLKLAALPAGRRPVFTLFLHLPNAETATLTAARASLQSLRRQVYPDWRLGLSGPAEDGVVRSALCERCDDLTERFSSLPRTDAGVQQPSFVVPLRAGDELGADALLEFALAIASGVSEPDFVYADERCFDPASRAVAPYFKPDWSADLVLSTNYIGRVWAASTSLFARAGLDPQTVAEAEYDSVLRLTETAARIAHIPKVLSARGSAPGEPPEREAQALADALVRRGIDGQVLPGCMPGIHRVKRKGISSGGVSIVMTTAGARGLFRTAIDSLRRLTDYPYFEIIAVDNIPAEDDGARRWLAANADRVIRMDEPFNWSRFNNAGAEAAGGDFLLFLNDDIEIIDPEWLDALLEHAQRSEVAVVGAQLLYPDRTVQHAGMFLSATGGRHPFRFLRQDAPGAFGRALTGRQVIAVTGACMLVRRDQFTALGGFDEAQGLINNDLDFCLRAHKAGLKTVFTPYARLIHHEKASRAALDESADQSRFCESWNLQLADGDPFFNPNLSKAVDDYLPDPEPVEILYPRLPLAAPNSVRRILVLKLDQIGDFVTALPALRRIKGHFPKAELVVVAPQASAALAILEPAIDRTIAFDGFDSRASLDERERDAAGAALAERLYPLRIDLAIDLRRQPETRPMLRSIGAPWLAGFDCGNLFPWLDVAVSWDGDAARTAKQRHAAEDLLGLANAIAAAFGEIGAPLRCLQPVEARQLLGSQPPFAELPAGWITRRLAAIHPAAGSEIKQWPAERFASLIDLLAADEGMQCLVIGSAADDGLAKAVLDSVKVAGAAWSVAGRIPLSELPVLLQGCDLLVGNNSGPQHLAAALGVPTVNIHSGIVDPREWGPLGPSAVTVRRAVTCSPCYLAEIEQCHRGRACLDLLSVQDVLRACRRVLDGGR